jgi:N-acetylneuraminic acid mutarotase
MIQRSITLATLFLVLFFTRQAEAGYFANTGLINSARTLHTATLLTNGNVLVAGGLVSGFSADRSAELYNPATGIWAYTGSMTNARYWHTATLLPSGKVLVTGGSDTAGNPLSSCELYDPTAGTWTNTGSLNTARSYHTATLLLNGKVLVAGSVMYSGGPEFPLASCELYDPVTGTWTNTGSLNIARFQHTATLLQNGKVLVAGGNTEQPAPFGPSLASAELYDPVTETWSLTTSNMAYTRYSHTATLLTDGRVLVTGGIANSGGNSSAEIYNPSTGLWSNTGSMNYWRYYHKAVLLPNGKVLVAGGENSTTSATTEIYDPTTEMWTLTGSMHFNRENHSMTMLLNGEALVAGGDNSTGGMVNNTELFSYIDPINLSGLSKLPSGAFQFSFTNTPGLSFSALATTNLSLSLSNWTTLGSVTEISPGQFQFTDTQATNKPQRFYRIQSNWP